MSLPKLIGNYHAGTIPHANVRRHEADAALKEMEQLVFSRDQLQKDLDELRVQIAKLATDAEAHRVDYNQRTNGLENPEYWAGRRDEAGHFRDRLNAIVFQAKRCWNCNGTGLVKMPDEDQPMQECPACEGHGVLFPA